MARLGIVQHAVERYVERIRPLPGGREREEILCCFNAAKEKHRRRVKGHRRTVMVPTGCCLLVFDHGVLVTVLERK